MICLLEAVGSLNDLFWRWWHDKAMREGLDLEDPPFVCFSFFNCHSSGWFTLWRPKLKSTSPSTRMISFGYYDNAMQYLLRQPASSAIELHTQLHISEYIWSVKEMKEKIKPNIANFMRFISPKYTPDPTYGHNIVPFHIHTIFQICLIK